MEKNSAEISKWLATDSKFIKVRVGEQYRCIFDGMKLDPTGGFKGKSTVRYFLKDAEDGKVRDMTSGSKAFAQKMMKVMTGDMIVISCSLNANDTKTYDVLVVNTSGQHDVQPVKEKDPSDEEEVDPASLEVPF